jgi:hypothetical protein
MMAMPSPTGLRRRPWLLEQLVQEMEIGEQLRVESATGRADSIHEVRVYEYHRDVSQCA